MPGREHTPNYRYGFNGKENDNEVKNISGSQQDYGMRIYDPRLGRFLSVDPLTSDFPWYSPYQFAGNKPIKFTDLDGEEEKLAGTEKTVTKTSAAQKTYTYEEILREANVSSPKASGYKLPSNIKVLGYASTLVTLTCAEGCRTREEYIADCAKQDLHNFQFYYDTFKASVQKLDAFQEALEKLKSADATLHDYALVNSVYESYYKNYPILTQRDQFHNGTLPIEWHHIIPMQLQYNPVVMAAIRGGYEFYDDPNLMPLLKYLIDSPGGVHANHPSYNAYVRSEIDDWLKTHKEYTDADAKDFIKALSDKLRDKINGTGEKVNDLGKRLKEEKEAKTE
jgi:RHS repeat-associated protein